MSLIIGLCHLRVSIYDGWTTAYISYLPCFANHQPVAFPMTEKSTPSTQVDAESLKEKVVDAVQPQFLQHSRAW